MATTWSFELIELTFPPHPSLSETFADPFIQVDKRKLEEDLAAHVTLPESQKGIRGFVAIKPSLLMDGDWGGLEVVRQGVPDKPAVGYTIRRQDVGLFICERLVKQDMREEWLNKGISITY